MKYHKHSTRPTVELVEPRVLLSDFTVVDYPGLAVPYTSVFGINDSGVAVGSYVDNSGLEHGFMKTASGFTTVDLPYAASLGLPCWLAGVNNQNLAVGYYGDGASNIHGFMVNLDNLADVGSWGTYDVPGAANTWLRGVNDAGYGVGYYTDSSGTHGFLDNDVTSSTGIIQVIDYGNGYTNTCVTGINNNGDVVGYFANPTSPAQGFLDSGGSFTVVDPQAAPFSMATGINDAGQIVGSYNFSDGTNHPFLQQSDSTVTDIPDPSGSVWTVPMGINNNSQVVGGYNAASPANNEHGFIWQKPTPPALKPGITQVSGSAVYGGTATIHATCADVNGDPLAGIPILFGYGSLTGPAALGMAISDADGVATLSTSLSGSYNAGTYNIIAGTLEALGYGTLTVAQAPLTVQANNATKVYGQPDPGFTASYSGFVLSQGPGNLGGSLSFSTPATAGSPVKAGGYPLTPGGFASGNYAITYVPGTLTVTPAPLVITAANQTMVVGDPLPGGPYHCSGFVNGDSVQSLTTPVRFSTRATSQSPAGTYAIVPGSATDSNYSITYVDGTLTILPMTVTVQRVFNRRHQVIQLLITFNGVVDSTGAQQLSTYRLVIAGRRGSFSARNAQVIRLKSVSYTTTKRPPQDGPGAASQVLLSPKPFKLSKPTELQFLGLLDKTGRTLGSQGVLDVLI